MSVIFSFGQISTFIKVSKLLFVTMSDMCVKKSGDCPIQIALSYLGKKWSFHIINSLFLDKHHFHEILDSYTDLSAKVLSERLKELEENGLIIKKVTPSTPVVIEYFLTKKGKSLNRVIYEIGVFASTHYRKQMNLSPKEFIQMKKMFEEKLEI